MAMRHRREIHVRMQREQDKRKARYSRYFERMRSLSASGVVRSVASAGPYGRYRYVDPSGSFAFPFRIRKAKSAHQPVVLFLPGAGCHGLDNIKPLAELLMHTRKLQHKDCTVLLPQTPYGAFTRDYPWPDALRQLCLWAAEQTQADTDRIYVFGISYGAGQTWRSAFAFPAFYACAMPLMGSFICPKASVSLQSLPVGTHIPLDEIMRLNVWTADDVSALRDTPIWVAHATDDTEVSAQYDDALVDALRKNGANVRYTRWDRYGHKMAAQFLKKEPWEEWMFAQNLRNRPPRSAQDKEKKA